MYVNTLTISSKGQIALPKKIRALLGSNVVSLKINEDNQVVISPICNIGGALSSYQSNSDLSFTEVREQAWLASTNKKQGDKN